MTKRMLIDATHAEENRVVVLDGNRLEDFDVETSTKKQLKGNIYLAKVVRVEPSLQAAFVEYGNGRHGFLAFGEIHPDYYQIPVADRQRLLEMQAAEARAEEDEEDEPRAAPRRGQRSHETTTPAIPDAEIVAPDLAADSQPQPPAGDPPAEPPPSKEPPSGEAPVTEPPTDDAPVDDEPANDPAARAQPALIAQEVKFGALGFGEFDPDLATSPSEASVAAAEPTSMDGADEAEQPDLPAPEVIGGESDVFEGNGAEEARARRTSRFLRSYRIQEVIRRRQIMLIQVVKEERGTKGAALTTYISLAGRFCVLMPNSPRGGGISRKITSAADRRRLKEITAELEIPQGMGLIVRTAGAARPKPEIKRDCEYLMRLWDDIRDHTMRSTAPALIYEEASLIKRSIRDVYSRDIEEVLVDGEDGWRAAHDFMRMLMPSHAKKVILWKGGGQPLFSKYGVEAQLEAMLSPTVQLKSGGYLVINQAEALVAIDVNSGRSTRERGIEETALRTNLEAADEVARQLRLRDLAGLIVIDFIDMEAKKHNSMVERRLKDALKNDRARIQVGFISHFGLMEMSRQRLRPSLTETSFVTCPHCAGLGLVRSVESSAIHVLRAIEEEGAKDKAALIMVHVANAIAMYILNNKRERLGEIEARYAMKVHFTADDTLVPPESRIDRLKPQVPEAERAIAAPVAPAAPIFDASEDVDDDDIAAIDEEDDEAPPASGRAARSEAPREAASEAGSVGEDGQRRRRRRRRGGRREQNEGATSGSVDAPQPDGASDAEPAAMPASAVAQDEAEPGGPATQLEAAQSDATETDLARAEQPSLDPAELDENGMPKARRRGRRGGRRRRRDGTSETASANAGDGEVRELSDEPQPGEDARYPEGDSYTPPVYTGPTPANPFGGHTYDIFDMIDRATEEPAPAAASALDIPPVPQPAAAPPPTPEPAPMSQPEPAAPPVAAATPVAEAFGEPVADVTPAPEPKPTMVPVSPPPAEPKRGWWRRS